MLKLETKESNGRLYWCGDYIGVPFEVAGNTCMPIKPYIDVNPPLDMSKYYFDMQMINDIGVHLIVSNPDDANVVTGSDSTIQVNKKCFVCKKSVKHQEMRGHIGGHILRDDICGANICGFCGRDVCTIEQQTTSKKGALKYHKISRQDCPYYFDYGRKAASSKKNPCTNRVIHCPIKGCISTIWIYNAKPHYEEKHPEIVDIPEINIKELKIVKSL